MKWRLRGDDIDRGNECLDLSNLNKIGDSNRLISALA
jgi:hypothetical protein